MAEDGFYILRATLCWLPVFEAVHALLFWISKRIHGPEVKVVHHEWANLLISVMQAMVSGVIGAYALMYEEPFASTAAKVFRFEMPTDTVHGYSATLQQGLPFICAYFAYDLLNMVLFVSSEALMVAHHILCLLVWPVSFHYRAGYLRPHPVYGGGKPLFGSDPSYCLRLSAICGNVRELHQELRMCKNTGKGAPRVGKKGDILT
ncbi:unnamed protein product [Symbiodinium natans]|uniref:TLC domain-containing protein n=1 Tax=Symbiodinium natans TaxID=878477 RepID=A0A812SXN8_9DINO|nr:unnamed protein product [Symbiodinium natans]